MPYLKTIHEKKSAGITTVIAVLVLLLLLMAGMKFMDPPIEYGVAVNFGTSDVGSGEIQPMEPIQSEPLETVNTPQEETIAESTKASETNENVLTADNAEAIAFKKQKEAEARERALADAKAKAEADKVAKEKRELEDKKRKLDALIGGVKSNGNTTGGEGNDGKAGDKGQLDGDPYAASYFGSGGNGTGGSGGTGPGGVGYGLKGRGSATYQTIKQDCNESGLVVVAIRVDRSGKVIKAEPGARGTTNTDPCLLEPARKIALSHKWPAAPNAPAEQIGWVKVNFGLGE